MIRLKNGHSFEYCCASGALAYDGRGWPWEHPFRWCGLLDPTKFTVITKTLTDEPRAGNLKMWCPWRCVRLLPGGGAVNAVGLTNPGYRYWIENYYKHVRRLGYDIIVSLAPATTIEAYRQALAFNYCPHIKGIELNFSCPNVDHNGEADHVVRVADTFVEHSMHPVIVKLGYTDPYVDICTRLADRVAAFDLINTVPWKWLNGHFDPCHGICPTSPLERYGIPPGGVSGPPIAELSRDALRRVRTAGVSTPIISGGGIATAEEAQRRFAMGASAVSFGTVFIRTPWRPNRIIRKLQSGCNWSVV